MSPAEEVVAIHGWGFDGSCWDPWREAWGPTTRFGTLDRGYFGEPREVRWREPAHGLRLILAHSMGLLFLAPDLLRRADAVVLFSCFLRFHPEEPSGGHRSRRILARMKARLRADPASVLRDFLDRSGLPARLPAGVRPCVSRLHRDLELLEGASFDPAPMENVGSVIVLHGEDDRIVPLGLGRTLHGALPAGARFHTVPHAGHGLPFTHVAESRRLVRRALEARS